MMKEQMKSPSVLIRENELRLALLKVSKEIHRLQKVSKREVDKKSPFSFQISEMNRHSAYHYKRLRHWLKMTHRYESWAIAATKNVSKRSKSS